MKKVFTLLALVLLTSSSLYGQLIINEVLYDPSNSGLDGDANGDGVYDQEEDAFIEFVNTGFTNFDASGYEIWDDTLLGSLRYVIPTGTVIPPLGAMVVFGGGVLTGIFGGAIVFETDSLDGLDLNNSGEVIAIKNPMGLTVLTFDSDALSNNPNESYTRNPDITGAFEQHNDNTPLLFSPGLRNDGTPFGTSLANDVTFTVDLSQYTGTFTTAYVNGDFNSFCGTCNPMTDVNLDGIWEVTIPITQDSIEYKFTLDGTTVEETLLAGTACTKTTGMTTNRFTLILGTTVLPEVCWEFCSVCFPINIALSLTGIIDFDLASGGSTGKAIHVTADSTIADLSLYAIGVANNGGGTDGVEYVFPAVAIDSGDQILVVRDSLEMANYFDACFSEFDHVFIGNSSISQNGNDAIELFKDSVVIETFADVNVDGTGMPWEYTGSWAYKQMGNWIYGGLSCTTGSTTTQTSACPYPICPVLPILVTSITVQGAVGASTISTGAGTLQMEADVLPLNATDPSFVWSVNDPTIATIDASGLLTAVLNGSVVVTATANDASSETGSTTILITNQGASIGEFANQPLLKLFPNPAQQNITFLTNENVTGISVYNMAGQLMENVLIASNTLNIETLESGMYFVVATINGETARANFVKQ